MSLLGQPCGLTALIETFRRGANVASITKGYGHYRKSRLYILPAEVPGFRPLSVWRLLGDLLSTMKKLAGKIAVITGGSSGLGLATARQFVEDGAYVFITGRREAELDAAVHSIGNNVTGVVGDVSNLEDLDRLFGMIERDRGRLDVVFANAGGGSFSPLGAISEAHFDQTFAVNVKGLLFTVQKALPLLSDGSSIILTGSATGSSGTPALSVYAASKAAVRSFARNWILDLKLRRIRVNTISPGPINTPGLDQLVPDLEQRRQMQAMLAEAIPLGRLGTPMEVARAVAFLASEESSFINGIELFIDGGMAQI